MENMRNGTPVFGDMMIFLIAFVIIAIAVGILQIIATWKLYRKAGEKGWAAIVPFYNLYVMVKIAWGNGWLFLLYLVPMGNIVFAIGTCVKLARAFGKGGGYAVGLIFLPYVFLSILGFGQAEYQGTDKFISKGIIIATAVTGGLYILFMVAVSALGFAAGFIYGLYEGPRNTDYEIFEDEILEDDDYLYLDEYNDLYDTEEDSDYQRLEDQYEPVAGTEYFVEVPLQNEHGSVNVPALRSDFLIVSDTNLSSAKEGVMSIVYLTPIYAEDMSEMVEGIMKTEAGAMYEMPEYYQNVTESEIVTGDGYAMQRLDYEMEGYGGRIYRGYEIIRCSYAGENCVTLILTVDGVSATEETENIAREAFEVYGIAPEICRNDPETER